MRDYLGEVKQKQGKSSSLNGQQPIEAAIGKSGLFNIPVLGGILRGEVGGPEAYGRMVAGAGYEAGRAGLSALGNKDVYKAQDPFLSNEDLARFGKVGSGAWDATKRTGGMETAVMGAKGLAEVPQGLKTTGLYARDILQNPTTRKLGARIAAKEAAGNDINWPSAVQKARSAVTQKATPIKQELESLIHEFAPETGTETTTFANQATRGLPQETQVLKEAAMTGEKAGSTRSELGLRAYGHEPGVPSSQRAAADILRREISAELKKSAPDLQRLDKLYGLYKNKAVGSPLRVLGEAVGVSPIVGAIISKLLGSPNQQQQTVDPFNP